MTDEEYYGKYCKSSEVLALFQDISDDPSEDLLKVAIDNTKAWIESNLRKNYIPVPENIPDTLKTVAIYYASSDILMSLYHGEDYESLMDYWFNKAQSLLEEYIDSYLNSEELSSETTDNIRRVKHSHARTYNQKRGRRGVRRWVR